MHTLCGMCGCSLYSLSTSEELLNKCTHVGSLNLEMYGNKSLKHKSLRSLERKTLEISFCYHKGFRINVRTSIRQLLSHGTYFAICVRMDNQKISHTSGLIHVFLVHPTVLIVPLIKFLFYSYNL